MATVKAYRACVPRQGGEGSRRPRGGGVPSMWCPVVRATPTFQTGSWAAMGASKEGQLFTAGLDGLTVVPLDGKEGCVFIPG